MKRNRIQRIFIAIASLLIMIVMTSILTSRVKAADSGTVYLKDSIIEANDNGLVIVEIVGEGKAGENVGIFFHTEGGTAIPDLDYVSVNTLAKAQYGSDGKLSYKVSIKTLVTPESREKLRAYEASDGSNTIYGRYFKFVIEKVNGATLVQEKSTSKCYLPYNFKAEVVTGKTQDTATHFDEPYAYFKQYGAPQTQHDSGDSLDGKSTWYSWKHGMTFNNDTSAEWITKFINQGIADAYGTFFIKKAYDVDSFWTAWKQFSSPNLFFHYGNKELVDTYDSDYNKDKDCPGLALYLETEPQDAEDVSAWYNPIPDWEPRGDRITPYAMKKILIEKKNPYDDDDHEREAYADEIDIKKETRTIGFFQQENAWYASQGSTVVSGAVKIEPYNGVLDTGFAVFNNNKEYDREVRDIYQHLLLVDSTMPEILGEFIDDSEYKTSGKLKIYIRFSEPVMMARTKEQLQITINNGTHYYYGDYVEGNYSDTLVYEVDAPTENIRDVKYQFPNDNVGDLAFNVDEFGVVRNNRLPSELTNKDRTLTFLNGAVNLLEPKITVDIENSPNPHNIYNILVSINNNGEKDIKDGKLYYTFDTTEEWVKEGTTTALTDEELADAGLYKNTHEFTPEENGSLTLTLVKNESEGIESGTYYLHMFAISNYGLTDVKTSGPYVLDGDPPTANQLQPSPNELKNKTYKLDLTKKNTEVDNIFVKFKYTDKNGASQEKLVQIIGNTTPIESIKSKVRITDGENNIIYEYDSAIEDAEITQIMNENNFQRIEFDVSFLIEDRAGNKTTTNIIKTVYDSRDLFKVRPLSDPASVPIASGDKKGFTLINDIDSVTIPVYDLSTIGEAAAEKEIYIEVIDEEGKPSVKENYIDKGAKFSVVINGKTTVNAPENNKYIVTLTDLQPGFYDIVPKITGTINQGTENEQTIDMVANNIQFYITNNKKDETENMKALTTDLVLTNKVFQLQDQRFYYLDQSGSTVISYPYGATYDETLNKSEGGSSYPSFSNINEAKKYVKFMELQDLYLVKLTPSIASLLNSGSTTTAYVKANGETVNAQEGQLWIRYKKNIWENTASAFGWAYYYYGNGNIEDGININALPTNLTNAMNEVINRITNKGEIVYLVEEETLNQRTGAPYLASTQIHSNYEEAAMSKVGSKFVSVAKYDGDKEIYKNTVKIKIGDTTKEYALATNMILKVTPSTRLFYLYSPTGDPNDSQWKEIIAQDGMRLSEVLPNQSSGAYLIREYGDAGVSEYNIYYDKSLPVIDVVIGESKMVLDGTVLSYSSDSFIIKGFANSIDYPAEVDDLAYIALFTFPNKKLIQVLYASDFVSSNGNDVKDIKLEEKNYYIQVGDRSGNIATYSVLLSNSDLRVEAYENESKTNIVVKVYERTDSEIYSYEVYCNEVLVTTEFAETKTFKEPGIYRINVSDIYGNSVSKTVEFAFKTPEIAWYYLAGEDIYSKYDPNKIVSMAIYDDESNSRITNVYTSAMVKLTFVTAYGDDEVKFEVLDLASGDYQYSDVTGTMTINKLTGFRLRVWFESMTQNDHTYIVRVDNEAPTVIANYIGTSFSYYTEVDENGNVTKSASFDALDLSKYNDGDAICLDTLAYVPGTTVERTFDDGATISGGHVSLQFQDPSKIRSFKITRNGNQIEMSLDSDQKLIINSYGNYEITVTDMLGNIRVFRFNNTDEPITNATIDDATLPDSIQTYGNDSVTLKALYSGEYRMLIETPNGKETLIFVYDGQTIRSGKYVCVVEKGLDSKGKEIDIKSSEYEDNLDADGKALVFDMNDNNIREKNWYEFMSNDYYVISIMVEEKIPTFKFEIKELESGDEPQINIEMLYNAGNTVFPSYYIASLSKEKPEIQFYSGKTPVQVNEDSKYTYIAETLTIDQNVNSHIVSIEIGYSQKPDIQNLEVIYQDGAFLESIEEENEGFYKIIVKNIFNNVREYMICKVDSFTTIVEVVYLDGSTREFLSNENVIYSNSVINFNVYSDSASFEIDGDEYAGIRESSITTLEMYTPGEHTVTVIGANNVREEFKINIGTDDKFIFNEEWLVGYTERALLKDQGYTSTPLTAIKADGVEYIAYKYGEAEISVLYDNISETKKIDTDTLALSIGNDGDGDYIVYFTNIYGDVGSKTIHYCSNPKLTLSRKTVANSNAFEAYDLNEAVVDDFYSNYILKFETTSLKYEFTIDGNQVSLDEPKTIEFSNSSGNGSFGYKITYLDEYGNYLEFNAELYRADVKIDTSLMKEIVVGNDVYTRDNIMVVFADNLEGYVSVDNGDYTLYESGTVFYKDGRYEFIVDDIAGNRATYIINHKSINHYTLTNTTTDSPVITGSVINNASVLFSASDDSKIAKVFKNSNLVSDYNTNSFTTTGHWEIIIEDSVGNQAYAGFYIINNPLISFEYQAPFDYEITEVWLTRLNGQREIIEAEDGKPIVLTENGDYAVVVTSKSATTTFNFSVTINNTPPTATLSGVEDGGVTARNVSLKGLKSGDIVEIYKNGKLYSTTDVSGSNSVPEITTGGEYKIIIKAVSGAEIEYNFTRKAIANPATSVFIIIACLVVVAGVGIGLLYHTKVKNDSEK